MHSWQPSMASIRWQRWCWRCIFYWEQPLLGGWGRWQGHQYFSQMFKLISSNKFGGGHPLSLSIALWFVWVGWHGDAFSIGEQPHLGRWGRWQGHPYLSQNNVSDLIPSRPMRYIYFEVGVSLYLMDPRDHWPVKNSDTLRIFPTAKRILWPARLGRNNLDICQSVMLNASLSCIGYCIYIIFIYLCIALIGNMIREWDV